jgi:hypothetical protein
VDGHLYITSGVRIGDRPISQWCVAVLPHHCRVLTDSSLPHHWFLTVPPCCVCICLDAFGILIHRRSIVDSLCPRYCVFSTASSILRPPYFCLTTSSSVLLPLLLTSAFSSLLLPHCTLLFFHRLVGSRSVDAAVDPFLYNSRVKFCEEQSRSIVEILLFH